MNRARTAIVTLALCLAAPAAMAEPTDAELAAARSLFVEARALEKEGKWEEALRKLEAVGDVRMTPQVRFHIALCHMNTGHLVAARNGFALARREAEAAKATQVIRESSEHIKSLDKRIPVLRIRLPRDVPDVAVRIDGREFSSDLLSVPIPLDPGEHRVQASATGFAPFDRSVSLEETSTQDLAIELRKLPPTPPAEPPPAIVRVQPQPSTDKPERPDHTVAWIAVGTGGALLAGAAVSSFVRASAISDIDESCPSHKDCDPALKDTRDRAQTFGSLGVVLGVLGVASAGYGGYVLLSSPNDGAAVSVAPASDGLGMTGTVVW